MKNHYQKIMLFVLIGGMCFMLYPHLDFWVNIAQIVAALAASIAVIVSIESLTKENIELKSFIGEFKKYVENDMLNYKHSTQPILIQKDISFYKSENRTICTLQNVGGKGVLSINPSSPPGKPSIGTSIEAGEYVEAFGILTVTLDWPKNISEDYFPFDFLLSLRSMSKSKYVYSIVIISQDECKLLLTNH